MEGNVGNFEEVGFSSDGKYMSDLSTLLVATIEEAKDRISQVEDIFCTQLFPSIELRSKNLQKWYSEASTAAEDAWKVKEQDLLLQIDELEAEKQKVLEENQSLKMQKAEPLEFQEEDRSKLLAMQNSLQKNICELEGELRQKSKELDEGMELQSKLLEVIQSNTCSIMNKEKQLRKSEEKSNAFLESTKVLDRKIDMLQKALSEKIDEAAREKEKQRDLLETIESQASEISGSEQKLNELEKEKMLVTISLEQMKGTVEGLREELRKKIEELEEGRVLRKQLIEQINLKGSQALKNTMEHENEKKLLEAKVNGLLERVDKLQEQLRGRGNEASCGRESCKKLLECVEQKSYELTAEKSKKQDIIAAYKRLKSQYNFLCSKYGLSVIPSQNIIEEENDSSAHIKKLATPTEFENKTSISSAVTCNMVKLKNEIMSPEKVDNENENKSAQPSTSSSRSTFISPHTSKCFSTVKSVGLSGSKRSASHWRETRSHQNQEGLDPHDDFLDTPFENVRDNMNKVMKEEVHLPVAVPKDMNFDCSDDETQDLNIFSVPQKQQMEAPKPSMKGFKYVEPVRKKADRENLQGIECKQCKKFYDAVLPDDGNERNLRCEHHDGVSRHRYKYAPPMTPEGFWNIGFESEM